MSNREEEASLERTREKPDTELRDIKKALESLISRKEKLLKNRQRDEITIENEREKRVEEAKNDAELSLKILEETLSKDLEMAEEIRRKREMEIREKLEKESGIAELTKKLEEAKRRREEIERDIENLGPELRAKYEKKFMEDLEEALEKEKAIAAELRRKAEEIDEKVAEEIRTKGLKGVPEEEKIRKQFEEERKAIEQRLQSQLMEIQRTYERKKNNIYQGYLKAMKDLQEEGMRELKHLINLLPEDKRHVSFLVFEYHETLREIEKSVRKFALDLKKRIEERKIEALERRLKTAEEEAERLRKERGLLEEKLKELKRELEKERTEKPDVEALKRRLEEELREKLRQEIKEDVEKQIRAELEKEQREKVGKKAVKKVKEEHRYPFVKCPECGERIEIKSDKRPLIVKCPGCGREYTLKTKESRNNKNELPATENEASDTPERASKGEESTSSNMEDFYEEHYFPHVGASAVQEVPYMAQNEQNSVGTKTVICPYCGKKHILPNNFTRKITCACGRRIRTI